VSKGSTADHRPPTRADLVFGAAAVVMFAAAGVATFGWPFRTALFPRLVTGSGTAIALLFTVSWLLRRPGPGTADPGSDEPEAGSALLAPEEDGRGHDVEYVYATAGRAAWAQALGWIAVFFLLLALVGLFAAAAAFTVAYLRWGGGRSWRFAVTYAVILVAVFYVSMDVLLTIPTPRGTFSW
jgi:hypothetical protein